MTDLAKRLGEIGDTGCSRSWPAPRWLLPVLAGTALDRITGEHRAMTFERLEMLSEEIAAAACVPVIKLHGGRHTAASLARRSMPVQAYPCW